MKTTYLSEMSLLILYILLIRYNSGMKKIIAALFLCISVQSSALEDREIIHTNQFIREAKILLSSDKAGDIHMASSLMSVYLMEHPEDKEAIELNLEIEKKMKTIH